MVSIFDKSQKPSTSFRFFLPVRIKLLVVFAIAVLVTGSLISCLFYVVMKKDMKESAFRNMELMADQASETIIKSFDEVELTFFQYYAGVKNNLILTSEFGRDLNAYSSFLLDSEINRTLQEETLFNPAWMNSLICSMHVFLSDGAHSAIQKTVRNSSDLNEAIRHFYHAPAPTSYHSSTVYQLEPDKGCFLAKKTFKALFSPQEKDVTIIIGVDEAIISRQFDSLIQYGNAVGYVVDKNGEVYISSDKNMLGKTIDPSLLAIATSDSSEELSYQEQPFMFVSRTVRSGEFFFIAGIPVRPILEPLYHELLLYLLAVGLITVVSLSFGLFFTLRLTGFIKELQFCMDEVKAGNYDIEMASYEEADITNISKTFNSMTAQIKHLINEVYSKQLFLKEAELKHLQAQMNPHFLFNVLLTIGYRARLSNDDQTYQMISYLLELLQAGIYSDKEEIVPIRKELDYIRSYLTLQKMRYDDRLRFDIQIENEDELLQCRIPRLCVEPIVENAVVHGLENKYGSGRVFIKVYENQNNILFEISDDGVGFSEESLRDFYRPKSIEYEPSGGPGIGLKNSDRRIKLMFGEEYGISIISEAGAGALVTVKIPKIKGEEHACSE